MGATGGIDLGGTKIEARLFAGPGADPVAVRRTATPRGGLGAVLDAVAAQAEWLDDRAGGRCNAVGVAIPGIVDPVSGRATAANLPWSGRPLAAALRDRLGRPVGIVNDGTAFALSEARGGAGGRARLVAGLVIGTGLGGGACLDGAPLPRHAGLGLEIGQAGVPAAVLATHGLPVLPGPLGRDGCFEAYLSGPGLAALHARRTGAAVAAEPVTDPGTLDVWADVAGEALSLLQMILDPEVVVLGGGVSRAAGVVERLTAALHRRRLPGARAPAIRLARFGDASGARGAALMAAAC